MAIRLPVPGSDVGTWGQLLNDFLSQAHNPDGTLRPLDQTQIKNLVADLAAKVDAAALAPVATSGSYNDLANKPAIPDTSHFVTGNGITNILQITQAAYDALAVKDSATLYVIVG
jgi:hypothetical protein